MAGTPTRIGFFIAALSAIAPIAAASEAPAVRYDITFQLHEERLDTVQVRATARTGDDGNIDFLTPWQGVAEVHAEQGSLDTSTDGHWKLHTSPGGEVVFAWRSRPAAAWRTLDATLWQSLIVRPDAAVTAGRALLALPAGSKNRLAELHWTAPPGWTVSTSLKQGTQTLQHLEESTFLAARQATTATRNVGDTTIRIATLDAKRIDVERAASDIAMIVEKAVPPALRHDFTLNIVDLDGNDDALSMTAYSPGGTAYLLPAVRADAWMPFAIWAATVPDDEYLDPAFAWYTQGFVAFRVLHLLRDAGRLPAAMLARQLDQATTRYGNSPFRRAPNRRVAEDYATIREMHDLPSARGELFALLVDAHIRATTAGAKSLDDALARMDKQMGEPGPALIDAVAAVGGGDITPLYQRYILDGELLQLPRDALGPCFTIGTVADESGWQVQHVFAKPSCPTPATSSL